MNQLFRLLLLSYFVLHVFCDEESFPQVLATYHLSFHNQPFSMWNHAVESNIHSGHHTGASWSPPRDICSSYYPAQGVYSSSDDNILEQHMKKLVNVGVNMIVVPFYLTQIEVEALHPHSALFTNGERSVDRRIMKLLKYALLFNIRVTFKLEDHRSRNMKHIIERTEHLLLKFGRHQSVYKDQNGNLVIFIEGSDRIPDWNKFREKRAGVKYIGKWTNDSDHASEQHMDGIFIDKIENWRDGVQWANEHRKYVILLLTPGFNDLRIRPWAATDVIERDNGNTYRTSWLQAIELKSLQLKASVPMSVMVVSFNDWCRSTQIEEASSNADDQVICKNGHCDKHGMCSQMMERLNIEPQYNTYHSSSSMYLDLTQKFSRLFSTDGKGMKVVEVDNDHDDSKSSNKSIIGRVEEMEVEAQ